MSTASNLATLDGPWDGDLGGEVAIPLAFALKLPAPLEGSWTTEIVDWGLALSFGHGKLRSSTLFCIDDGELPGKVYSARQTITAKSFPFLRNTLEVVAGKRLTSAEDIYDPLNDCAGPIRECIVGALVEIRVVRRRANGRWHTNVEVLKLLRPAPDGTSRSDLL